MVRALERFFMMGGGGAVNENSHPLWLADVARKIVKSLVSHWLKIPVLYKTPHLIYEPQLAQHCKKYTPTTQSKTYSLCKFSSKHSCSWCQKTTFAMHHF